MNILLLGAGMMSSEILWMVQYCLNDANLRALNNIPPKINGEVERIYFFDEYKKENLVV